MKLTGQLLIDGNDAFTDYGVFVEQYGYKQLIQMPSFKSLTSTEWPEYDGEEVDLMDPQLDTRTLQIQFCITNVRYAEDLFDELSINAYHEFYFAPLQKTYKLRMTQNGSFSSLINQGKLTLTFADDFPEVPAADYKQLNESDIRQVGYELDGIDFSQFGSYILKGTDDNIRKAAQVRAGLTVSAKNASGVIYDDENVTFKTKEVTLKLLIDAPDIAEFWARYNSLFAVLLKAESRRFYFRTLGNEYDCYYKSSSVSKFDILRSGKVWCEFSVTLVFTDYHPVGQYMLLATEDFDFVTVSVNGVDTLIRIRPRRGISLLTSELGEYIVVNDDEDKIYIND